MDKISTPSVTKEIIKKHQFKFSKSLGQNFLIDFNIIDSILEGADINENDYVIEVGPGIGSLTSELAKKSKKVLAVEIDKKLIPILKDTLSIYDNVEVVNEDILKVDIKKLINEKLEGKSIKLVANLPYYITTPIVMKFLEDNISVNKIVVMVQKEVADRMRAVPSTKDYGALSVAVQFYSEPYIVTKVSPSCFVPQPNVESTVIGLDVFKEKEYNLKDKNLFFKVVKASFSKRRKTLLNALSSSELNLLKEEAKTSLKNAQIDEKRRGETLTIDEFINLSNAIYDIVNS